jgi:hypothetical protein
MKHNNNPTNRYAYKENMHIIDNYTHLNLSSNLKTLDNLPPYSKDMIHLNCSNNNLTELGNLPNSLKGLFCNNNKNNTGGLVVKSLPTSLYELSFKDTELKQLPSLPPDLHCLRIPLTENCVDIIFKLFKDLNNPQKFKLRLYNN